MTDKGHFLPLARARTAAAIEAAETDQAERKRTSPLDSFSKRSPTHKRGQGPFHERFKFKLDDVDSLSTFVDHFQSFPKSCFQEYGALDETNRKLFKKAQSSFVGKGLSFLVSVTSGRQLEEPIISKFPEKELRRHETIATKIPRIEPKKSNAFNLAGLKAYSLRAVAWETHCLLHPPIRRSKYVVDLLGLAWEPARTEREQWIVVPALVMEYADEGTLDDLLQCGEGVTSFELKFKLALDVALGLETLHRHGLVHSDLKANNVLLFRCQSETLVAKISDFGCAVHDFGPSETVQLPPYWPRWDAPEARPPTKTPMVEKIPKVDIKVEEVPKVDVYCFGLLFWQMMLDGKTPFDRGREVAAECNIPCFEPIIYATSEEDKKHAIADLKDRPDDEFLRAVRVTASNRGLDQQVVHDILSQTIRRNPDSRSQMTQLIDGCFERSFAEKVADERAASMSVPVPADILRNYNPALYTPAVVNRLFYGVMGLKHDVLDFSKSWREDDLPTEVTICIREEYLQEAQTDFDTRSEAGIAKPRKAFAALQLAFCYLAGFGCDLDHVTGLSWLCKAAELENLQAQTLVYRLHKCYGHPIALHMRTLRLWLLAATVGGSRLASEDLTSVDPTIMDGARNAVVHLNYGETGGRFILVNKQKVVERFSLEDNARLRERFSSSTHNGTVNDVVDAAGHTLLHYCSALGYAASVRVLLELGADIDNQDKERLCETALSYACLRNYPRIVRELLDRGADASIPNLNGATPLHFLVFLDDGVVGDIARQMVEKNQANVEAHCRGFKKEGFGYSHNEFDFSGTALHWAVQHDRLKVAEVLLQLGADPLRNEPGISFLEHASSSSQTISPATSPMHRAAKLHRCDVLELFLKYTKWLPEHRRKFPSTWIPMDISKVEMMCLNGDLYKERFLRTVELLNGEDTMPVLMARAIQRGQLMLIENILKSGYDIDTPGVVGGMTALLHSLTLKDGDISLYLLQKGADPTCQGPGRFDCPLSILAQRPDGTRTLELVRKLIEGGNTYEKEPGSHKYIYMRAVVEGWGEIADLILHYGLPQDSASTELFEILLAKNSTSSLRGLQCLLEHVPQALTDDSVLNEKTGGTVFHYLLRMQETIREDDLSHDILKMLLTKFSKPETLDVVDKFGFTAMAIAVVEGNHLALETLLSAGASPSIGRIWPSDLLVDRLHFPTVLCKLEYLDGDVSTASSRGRRKRRYEENTVKLLGVLLRHEIPEVKPEVLAEDFARASYRRWRDIDTQKQALAKGFAKASGIVHPNLSVVDIEGSQGGKALHVFDPNLGTRRAMSLTETLAAVRSLWATLVDEWRTVQAAQEA